MIRVHQLYVFAVVNICVEFATNRKVQKMGGGGAEGGWDIIVRMLEKRERKKDAAFVRRSLSQHVAGLV